MIQSCCDCLATMIKSDCVCCLMMNNTRHSSLIPTVNRRL
jgi:hypothetical protein